MTLCYPRNIVTSDYIYLRHWCIVPRTTIPIPWATDHLLLRGHRKSPELPLRCDDAALSLRPENIIWDHHTSGNLTLSTKLRLTIWRFSKGKRLGAVCLLNLRPHNGLGEKLGVGTRRFVLAQANRLEQCITTFPVSAVRCTTLQRSCVGATISLSCILGYCGKCGVEPYKPWRLCYGLFLVDVWNGDNSYAVATNSVKW